MYRDITAKKFEQLHEAAFQDTWFVDSVLSTVGLEPASKRWRDLSLPGKSLLEIGPGTGHLLAAAHKAGRLVTAVESSKVHREFIQDAWGIDSLYPDISALPADLSFDAIVAINVIEHVYDIGHFFRSISGLLAPNGVLFVSTANAKSLEATLLRSWWSMCKDDDHVSLPTPDGIALSASASGLRTERVWSSELPYEFPISALVATRDWTRARRGSMSTARSGHSAGIPVERAGPSTKARLARFYSISNRFDPTSRMLAAFGRAGSVKARLSLAGAR